MEVFEKEAIKVLMELFASDRASMQVPASLGEKVIELKRMGFTEEDLNAAAIRTWTIAKVRHTRRNAPCTFYGFFGGYGQFNDSGGNGCGLTFEHRPCGMEMAGKKPCWHECPKKDVGNAHLIVEVRDWQIFPHELQPAGSWTGIPVKEFHQMLFGTTYPN